MIGKWGARADRGCSEGSVCRSRRSELPGVQAARHPKIVFPLCIVPTEIQRARECYVEYSISFGLWSRNKAAGIGRHPTTHFVGECTVLCRWSGAGAQVFGGKEAKPKAPRSSSRRLTSASFFLKRLCGYSTSHVAPERNRSSTQRIFAVALTSSTCRSTARS